MGNAPNSGCKLRPDIFTELRIDIRGISKVGNPRNRGHNWDSKFAELCHLADIHPIPNKVVSVNTHLRRNCLLACWDWLHCKNYRMTRPTVRLRIGPIFYIKFL